MVINPPALVGELDGLAAAGFDCANLFISERAHLVMPYHVLLDQLEERERGTAKLGTTSRGIGPAYVDKVARRGIRMVDLMEPDTSGRGCTRAWPCPAHRGGLLRGGRRGRRDARGHRRGADEERIAERYLAAAERLRPHVVDGQAMVDAALSHGERILLEGQLGTMRDIDWGTYPYVTSSCPIPGGAILGAGLPAVAIDQVIGVAKAYTTAVGAGPLPTELLDAEGERCASGASSSGPRPAARGAAAGTTPWRCASACGWPATRASR